MAKRALTPQQILSATRTVNEDVLDRAIRHAHYVQRLKTHEVNEIVGFLNRDVLPDALSKLRTRLERTAARGFETGPWTSKRLKETIAATNEIMRTGLQEAGAKLRKDLRGFALTEAEWQVRAMQRATGVLNIAFDVPSVRQLNSILTSRPYEGHVFKEWWGKVSTSSQDIISSQVSIGVAEGETVDQIVRRLRGTVGARFADGALEKVRHNVDATVRTAVNHVNTHAREMTFKENDDVVKGVQFVATLDGRTTDICMSLDGQVFDIDDGPRPPMHYQCRSTTVPVLKSLEELGLPKLRKALPEGTRATKSLRGHLQKAMNGQVPARVTYGKWLRKQSRAVQNDALGPARAKLFRSGKVGIDRFVDSRHRPLTLEQIRKREGLSIPRRKIPGVAVRPIGRVDSKVWHKWRRGLSQAERDALHEWRYEDHRRIRRVQLKGTTDRAQRKTVAALQRALEKSPRAPGEVWRGLSDMTNKDFKRLATQETINIRAVSSSSTNEALGTAFAKGDKNNILFEIRQRTGTAIGGGEDEILLHKGASYAVTSREWISTEEWLGGKLYTHEILKIMLTEVGG